MKSQEKHEKKIIKNQKKKTFFSYIKKQIIKNLKEKNYFLNRIFN